MLRQSRVYETEPVGGPDHQGPYLNMVAVVETPLDPFAFIRRCQRIEALAGRQRIVHWGPRTLDIDLIAYDDVARTTPMLTLPHPRALERAFVLLPLAEIAPEGRILGVRIKDALTRVDQTGIEKLPPRDGNLGRL